MIQRPMIQDEIQRRINTYSLAVDPLVKIAVRIQLLQPIGCRVNDDGTLEWIEQYGWSEEAKSLYAAVQKEIEYLRGLYFGEPTEQRKEVSDVSKIRACN